MRTIIAFSIICLAVLSALAVDWVTIPFIGTNYTRTNVPYWWSDGTNRTGVAPWQLAQAINENFSRASNALAVVWDAPTNSMLKLTPRTISNATNTTWGSGAGIICVDSNYVYVSVGTNSWKRASLSSW